MMDSGKDPASASMDKAADIPRADMFTALWLDGVRTCFPTDKGASTIPYPGLRSFFPELNQFFCARDIQKEALHSFFIGDGSGGLGPRRLTFVVGGSGSGKSSLTRAGLIAELGVKSAKDHWGAWYVVEMRPATDPVAQLQGALWKNVLHPLIDAFFAERKAEKVPAGEIPSQALPLEQLVSVLRSLGIELADQPTHAEVVAQVDRWLEEKISPRPGRISSTGLFSFVTEALSALDLAASAGDRGGPPMLLLHIDQFEEVFRDECDPDGRTSLIGLLRDIHNYRPECLFAVATMRSEELHRLSEHPGMAEAINTSLFLVELVGNDNVEMAIVEPARRMAERWVLPLADFMPGHKSPYTAAAVQELKNAYREADSVLEHKADKLPLLQHALPLIWSAAVNDWIERRGKDPGAKFVIDVEHLQKVSGWKEAESTESKSRLGRCLNQAAESAYVEAAGVFAAHIAGTSGEADGQGMSPAQSDRHRALADEAKGILTVALNCLAQLDDRRNAARRFVPLSEMLASAAGIERLQTIPRATLEEALKAALAVFDRAGLVERLVDDEPETEDLYNVTHESLIRNWVAYGEKLKQQWLLQKRLHAFTRPDFRLKSDEDYGFLARRLKRNWAEAASAIQKLSRDALSLALGPRPLYSTAWISKAIRRAEERDKSPPVDEAELSDKLAKLGVACDNAEKWETNENYFVSLERRATGGIAALVVAVVLLGSGMWALNNLLGEKNHLLDQMNKLLGEMNALLDQKNTILAEKNALERQYVTMLWLGDFLAGQIVKDSIYDRMLGFMIKDAKDSYKNREKYSDRQQRNLRRIISRLDDGMRRAYETEIIVSFNSPFDSELKGKSVRCNDYIEYMGPGELGQKASTDTFGRSCRSESGRWELTFAWRGDNPAIFIKRKVGEADRTEDVRVVKSLDSVRRLEELSKIDLRKQIEALKSENIEFLENDGIVSFKIKDLFADQPGIKDLYVWTPSGLIYAADTENGSRPSVYKPCIVDKDNTCRIADFDFDGDDKPNKDLSLFITRQPSPEETDSAVNLIGIGFAQATEAQPAAQGQQAFYRATISDFGPAIKEIAFSGGWLWIRDAKESERRYMVSEDNYLRILQARWRDVRWRPDDKFGIDFKVSSDCEALDWCPNELKLKDDGNNGDEWPGGPSTNSTGSNP